MADKKDAQPKDKAPDKKATKVDKPKGDKAHPDRPAKAAFSKESIIDPFRVGDTVRVQTRIREGDKERLQAYEGTVIARSGRGNAETFTVRRLSHGVGVERVFPVKSPHLARVHVTGSGHSRRAKLYYLRDRAGRSSRLRDTRQDRTETPGAEPAATPAAPAPEKPTTGPASA